MGMTSKRDGVHLAGKRAEKSRLGSGDEEHEGVSGP
jgi:hypothetical protein